MRIEGDGFLTQPLPRLAQTVPGASQGLFDLLHELCLYAKAVTSAVDLDRQETLKERQKIIVVICLIRLIEATQSILILSAHGVREELHSLLRVFFDAYFVLANCCSDKEFVQKFLQRDVLAREKLLRAAARHDSNLFRKANEYATPDVMAKLQALKEAAKIQPSTAEQYAKNVGCQEIYDSIYRITSPYTA